MKNLGFALMLVLPILTSCDRAVEVTSSAIPPATRLEWSDNEVYVPSSDSPPFEKLSVVEKAIYLRLMDKNSVQKEQMAEMVATFEGVGTPYSTHILESQKKWRFEFSKCGNPLCSNRMLLARNLYLAGALNKLKESVTGYSNK